MVQNNDSELKLCEMAPSLQQTFSGFLFEKYEENVTIFNASTSNLMFFLRLFNKVIYI